MMLNNKILDEKIMDFRLFVNVFLKGWMNFGCFVSQIMDTGISRIFDALYHEFWMKNRGNFGYNMDILGVERELVVAVS